MRHIGIMGGTFNPPHLGHLTVAQCGLDQFKLDKVLFIPSGQPPHKSADLLDKELRFEMVAAAVADNPYFEASRIEVDRPGVTWTIDTLKQLQQKYGDYVRLNFIMGEDNINVLKLYDKRTEFLSLCRLLVCPRVTADQQRIEQWKQILPEADLEVIEFPPSGLSSTMVRSWVRKGRSIRYVVPAGAARIIADKGLYKVAATTAPSGSGSQPPAPTGATTVEKPASDPAPSGAASGPDADKPSGQAA